MSDVTQLSAHVVAVLQLVLMLSAPALAASALAVCSVA